MCSSKNISCIECGEFTKNPKFCSSSCSAKHNNKKRNGCINKNLTKKSNCIECNNEIVINIRSSHNQKCFDCKKPKCRFCGSIAKFRLKNKKYCCSKSPSQCPSIKLKNSLSHKFTKDDLKKIKPYKYALTYTINNRICSYDPNLIFIKQKEPNKKYSRLAKNFLIDERGRKCECCNNFEWNGLPIVLELEHIDGDNRNNDRENLEALCPNCHSLTDTWRGRNKNSGKPFGEKKISDEVLLICLLKHNWNMRQSLLELNYAAKGGNYKRCHKLKRDYEELINKNTM